MLVSRIRSHLIEEKNRSFVWRRRGSFVFISNVFVQRSSLFIRMNNELEFIRINNETVNLFE